ncbi:hypothetical protein [Novacetimonas pomaceti]|uniref:hypothetical protein n=1 Tax=Novacetimonas pomaceti TaxID=2021998 RepID=UPI0038CF9EF1
MLVWNRLRYLKDPQTGRRLARPNPPESWIRTEVLELRIVSDALWQSRTVTAGRNRKPQQGDCRTRANCCEGAGVGAPVGVVRAVSPAGLRTG